MIYLLFLLQSKTEKLDLQKHAKTKRNGSRFALFCFEDKKVIFPKPTQPIDS
jgi:hypothetical protein